MLIRWTLTACTADGVVRKIGRLWNSEDAAKSAAEADAREQYGSEDAVSILSWRRITNQAWLTWEGALPGRNNAATYKIHRSPIQGIGARKI